MYHRWAVSALYLQNGGHAKLKSLVSHDANYSKSHIIGLTFLARQLLLKAIFCKSYSTGHIGKKHSGENLMNFLKVPSNFFIYKKLQNCQIVPRYWPKLLNVIMMNALELLLQQGQTINILQFYIVLFLYNKKRNLIEDHTKLLKQEIMNFQNLLNFLKFARHILLKMMIKLTVPTNSLSILFG